MLSSLTLYIYDKTQTWEFSLVSPHSTLNSSYIYNRYWKAFEISTFFPCIFTTNQPQIYFEILEAHQSKFAVFNSRVIIIERISDPVLLVTDLDHTLLDPSPEGLRAASSFVDYWLAHHYFLGSKLVYNTGRYLEEYYELEDSNYEILDPDLLGTSVGSDVYRINTEGKFELVEEYFDLLDNDHWDTNTVAEIVDSILHWQLPRPRPITEFSHRVLRLAYLEDIRKHAEDLRKICEGNHVLANGNVLKCKVCISGPVNVKFIDFIPSNGGKHQVKEFAEKYFGKFDKVLVAGDSGNDLQMFKGKEFGVIVHNRGEEMDNWYNKKKRHNKYISELNYAYAIIEALDKLRNGSFLV